VARFGAKQGVFSCFSFLLWLFPCCSYDLFLSFSCFFFLFSRGKKSFQGVIAVQREKILCRPLRHPPTGMPVPSPWTPPRRSSFEAGAASSTILTRFPDLAPLNHEKMQDSTVLENLKENVGECGFDGVLA
jgi:hypothetical protein